MLSCHVVTNDTRKPKVAIVSEEPVAPIPIGPSNSLSSPFSFLFFFQFLCPFLFCISLPGLMQRLFLGPLPTKRVPNTTFETGSNLATVP